MPARALQAADPSDLLKSSPKPTGSFSSGVSISFSTPVTGMPVALVYLRASSASDIFWYFSAVYFSRKTLMLTCSMSAP